MTRPVSSHQVPWKLLAVLGLVVVAMRLAAALIVGAPPYLDPAYYELVARRLLAGDGFNVPVLWSFLEVGGALPANPTLPVPSNAHWMPLTSIVAAGSMALFGASRLAAQLPSILLGAALVPITAFIGFSLWRSRSVALVSGVLALFAGPMLVYVSTVDAFALFGVAGVVAIYASMRSVTGTRGGWWLLVAGVAVGVATLTRIDGVLLGSAPLTAWLIRTGLAPWRAPAPPIGVLWIIGATVLGLAVLSPWLVRQWIVFGTPLPSAGGHTLWITSYNEQFSVGHAVDVGTYLQWGPLNIVASKLESWGLLLGRTAVLLGGIFLLPFIYGLVHERRRSELAPFLVYFAVMFITMGLVFTFHAPQGAFYHSAWAWLPFAIPLGVASFKPALERLGRIVPLFGRPRNIRFVMGASIVGAIVLSAIGSAALLGDWRAGRDRLGVAADFIGGVPREDVIMYVDPPSLNLATGNPVIAPPFDPPPVIGQVASAYGARWLVVERLPGASSDPLGLWGGADWLAERPALDTPTVRIYEVEASAP